MATVEKRGDSYKITVSCGYRIDGSQVRRNTTWTPAAGMTEKQTAKELERQRVLFEEACKSLTVADGNIKFEAFTAQWFKEYATPKLKTRTVENYHQFEDRVFAAIGHLRMDRITTRVMQKFILNLAEPGVNTRTGGGMAPKSIKNYLSFVSSVFDYALSQGVVKENPCRLVSLPSIPPIERDYYSLEEAQHFLDLLNNEPLCWLAFFTLAIYGGFRRGELCGFEWKDIDFSSGIVTVNRTSNYTVKSGVFVDTPKTKGSQRSLKMPNEVIALLRKLKAEQDAQALHVGDQWIPSDRLFVTWNGNPIHPNRPQNWLTKFCERTDMRKVNIHSFRHLNISLLINSGADIKTVSAAAGHNQTSTTLNIYTHSFAEAQAKASDAVADAIHFRKKRKIKMRINPKQTPNGA